MEMEFICLFCLKYSFFDNDKKHKWRLYGNENIGEHVWVHISIVENQKYTKKKKRINWKEQQQKGKKRGEEYL